MPVLSNTAFSAVVSLVTNFVNSHASCLWAASLGIWMYVPPLLNAPPGGVVTRQLPAPLGSMRFSRLLSIQPPITTDAILPLCNEGAQPSLQGNVFAPMSALFACIAVCNGCSP